LHKIGLAFKLGSNPAYDILGRSMPARKKHLSRAIGQIGIVVEEQ
jgi:hypothetical protein